MLEKQLVVQFTEASLKHFTLQHNNRLTHNSWASLEYNFFYYEIPQTGSTAIKRILQAHCGLIYLSYIAMQQGVNLDIHFRSQSHVCFLDQINDIFNVSVERFSEDVTFLLEQLNTKLDLSSYIKVKANKSVQENVLTA